MNFRFYIPVYAFTLLLSAALLFSIQPLFSKMILPLLGGTPQVWTTAMLFFQICLLSGYAYAHGTTRFLNVRRQALTHLILLCVCAVILPIGIPEGWHPPTDQDPTLWQLSLMAVAVGGPFFILAASAPMLQRWFAESDHRDADNPYFLYGASNLGSMTSLLAYPVVLEPLFTLPMQSIGWSIGYGVLAFMMVIAALLVWNTAHKKRPADRPTPHINDSDAPSWQQRLWWVYLAFLPSSMMLGVTTYITTDIASVPLIWVLPLALYVGTFIIAFARRPVIPPLGARWGFDLCLMAVIVQLIIFSIVAAHPYVLIGLHFILFFFAALMTHFELVRRKPRAAHLTEFYLLMSLGGALGGVFNAVIAPNFLIIPIEYGLVLILSVFVRFSNQDTQHFARFYTHIREQLRILKLDAFFTKQCFVAYAAIVAAVFAFGLPDISVMSVCAAVLVIAFFILRKERWVFGGLTLFVLCLFPPGYDWGQRHFDTILHQDRNFFGVIRVVDMVSGERILLHGTTNHGSQALDARYRLTPLAYYSKHSPVHDTFEILNARAGAQNIAVVGLGVGVTACFHKDGRHFDFYEIDRDIAQIAENPAYFTFLSDCGSPYDILLGDGRLQIQNAPDNHYDMVFLDAFSSDNIPVHLLTQEAVRIYLRKLKDDGILIFNVSNNFLDIEPVLSAVAKAESLNAYARLSRGRMLEDTGIFLYPAHYLVMTRTPHIMTTLRNNGWTPAYSREGVQMWSDQYSNILGVLGNQSVHKRIKSAVNVTRQTIRMEVKPESNPLFQKDAP